MRHPGVLLAIVFALYVTTAGSSFALSANDVLVVFNSQELPDPSSPEYATACQVVPASRAIAEYYASMRQIPSNNLLGLPFAPFVEYVQETELDHSYTQYIATPISNYLSSHPQIRCIVLCYGVPSRILTTEGYYSVDSALTVLGNVAPNVRHWGLEIGNPYLHKNADFDEFRDSPENVTIRGYPPQTWKLNYLVTRLDGFSTPTDPVPDPEHPGQNVEIPRYVKQMIDKSVDATAGGAFVIDPVPLQYKDLTQLEATGANILTDYTSLFLTGQQDVIGYFGEHMSEGHANDYTTWGRPLNMSWNGGSWHDGGVAFYNTNDGQSFRTPKHIWGTLNKPLQPWKVRISDWVDGVPGFQVVLRAAGGGELARGTFDSNKRCTLDLAGLSWPDDHRTYLEVRYPVDDEEHPDEPVQGATTPADTQMYDSRLDGIYFIYQSGSPPLVRARSRSPGSSRSRRCTQATPVRRRTSTGITRWCCATAPAVC